MACAAVLCVACTGPSSPPTDPATGLEILDELPQFPGSVAASEWEESSNVPAELRANGAVHATVADLVAAIRDEARDRGFELTLAFLGLPTDEAATLVVHAEQRGDELVAGDELVMEIGRGDRGWYIDHSRSRRHCRHAIDSDTKSCT